VADPLGARQAATSRPSLGRALNGHRNSLGLVRLILASAVIFHHSFPLAGLPDPFLLHTRGQGSIGSLAVAGFFVISGYLITKSGMNTDVMQFFWHRVLRIFPAYWTVLVVTAFAVGPALWAMLGRGVGSYFREDGNGPVHYITANWNLSIGTWGIHDLLATTTPYGRATHASVFNGAIWTLSDEWICYLIIGLLVLFAVLTRARLIVPAVAALLFLAQIIDQVSPGTLATISPFLHDPNAVNLVFTFMVGATLAIFSKSVPFDNRLGILSALILLATLRYGGYTTVGTLAGAYFVLYLAARLPKRLQWVGQKNDYSYGVYIYGFLVQQVLANFGVWRLGYFPFAFISLAIALGCAWLSWHIVEKNAMRLKDFGPGRGLRYFRERWWAPRRKRLIRPLAMRTQPAEIPPAEITEQKE
jgi:peptidoglycan/LPS O-acetylase OafA/YrhL